MLSRDAGNDYSTIPRYESYLVVTLRQSEDDSCNPKSAGLSEAPSPRYHQNVFLLGQNIRVIAIWSINHKQCMVFTVLPQLNKVQVSRRGGTPKVSPMKNRTWGAEQWETNFTGFIDEKGSNRGSEPSKHEGPSCLTNCCRLWYHEPFPSSCSQGY